jgi:tetratricopeptide (TPR) repeat protein
MENDNLDKTIPGEPVQNEPEPDSNLEQTIRISLNRPEVEQKTPQEETETSDELIDLSATMPTHVQTSEPPPLSLDDTMPSLVRLDMEDQPGFEATIPPPPEPMSLSQAPDPALYAAQADQPPAETADDLPQETPAEQSQEITPEYATPAISDLPPDFPGDVPPEAPVQAQPPSQPRRLSARMVVLFGILGLVLVTILSAFGGYRSGIGFRQSAESTVQAIEAEDQFNMALDNMANKEFDLARQRLEYVIEINPNFPGVTEQLAAVLLELSITATPTFVPTPTLTPTPDTRGEEELFSQAQQALYNSDWNAAIEAALSLRKKNIDYNPVQVDGILYVAYGNLGKDKILRDGDLEGGIYDLTISERFGPLDTDAKGYITWARLYILGASFWEVDWSQAVYYFGQVAPALPNLRDGSGWTATERFRLALIGYGDQLASRKQWCAAAQQYEQALAYGADDTVQQSYNTTLEKCEGPKPTEVPATEEPTSEDDGGS